MKSLVLWVIVGLVLLHLFLHVGIGFGAVAPDLFVVALLVASRRFEMGTTAGIGFFLGLLEDAFSALSFGANSFSMTVTGILASRSRDLFVGDSVLFMFLYFALGKWTRELLAWVVSDSVVRSDFSEHLLFEAPLASMYVAVIGVGAALLVGRSREGSE